MAILGLGTGLIISSLTTKYRDLKFLIVFGIQLAMYGTPIVYPLAAAGEHQWILKLNPMTNIVETFKVALFGIEHAQFDLLYLMYSIVFSVIMLFFGIRLFNKIEKSFMDTI
jgi:lipopolysaccharide transport system permease protein